MPCTFFLSEPQLKTTVRNQSKLSVCNSETTPKIQTLLLCIFNLSRHKNLDFELKLFQFEHLMIYLFVLLL